jgi:excisionase family DNA binding protein
MRTNQDTKEECKIVNQTQESPGLSKKTAKKTRHRGNIGKWAMQENEGSVPRRLMDITEASLYIGLQIDTIYRMVSQRRIPFVKVGRRTMFDIQWLDDWLDQHTVLPTP